MEREQPGISAVVMDSGDLDQAVLDLAAVLDGLAPGRFEILVVGDAGNSLKELRARAPLLPIRAVSGEADPRFELILVPARDGQYDVRELNHLLEPIERGADVVAGVRPHRTDRIVRRLQRWGWHVDVDCAFALLRRVVWQRLTALAETRPRMCCTELSGRARRLGFDVQDVPVSQRRPSIGATISAGTRAA